MSQVRYPLRTCNPMLVTRLQISNVRDELAGLPESMWNQHPYRTKAPRSPHCEVDDIILRFQASTSANAIAYAPADASASASGNLETVPYPAWWNLVETRTLIYRLVRTVPAGRIGRAVVTRLRPGKQIFPHVDDGTNAGYYDRFQICVRTNKDCWFKIGAISHQMHPGEIWWFDNRLEHGVVNNGTTDRIAVVLDLRVESEKNGWRDSKASDHRTAGAAAA